MNEELVSAQKALQGKVITVQGPKDPAEIGTTLMHEHVLIDLSCNFSEPQQASLIGMRDAPVTMDILGLLRRNPFGVTIENARLVDEDDAVAESVGFLREGGTTIVDVTNIGLARDPAALKRISNASGLNFVMGAGLYVEAAHPDWAAAATIEELRDQMIADVLTGVDGTGIRSGIIGEIGTSGIAKVPSGSGLVGEKSGDVTAQEEKVLRAAAQAARFSGASVTVHLHPGGKGALRVIGILEDEGLSPDRMVMGHLDWIEDYEYHRSVAETGAYVEFDSLGREHYIEGFGWCGSDVWRVDHLARLCADGFEDQILVSQDCCLKTDLKKYGGVGYGHILRWIVPMMRAAEISEGQIHKFLVTNPRSVLTIVPGIFDEASNSHS